MATYDITCATKAHPHRHILTVGDSGGSVGVMQARQMIANGDIFNAVSPTTGKRSRIYPWDCSCGVKSLRSASDGVWDNNLDNLPACS